MVQLSKSQAERAKASGAKVTKKLQVKGKPEVIEPVKLDQPQNNPSIEELAKLVHENAIENERRFARHDILIKQLSEAVTLLAEGKPVRLKIHRESSPQRLMDSIDLIPLKRITH